MKEKSINLAGSIIIFFIILSIFAKWGPSINFTTTTQTKGEPFVVQGVGKSTVSPDIAKVDLGIEETGQNLKTVQDSVNKKSQTIVAGIKKMGIDEDDIKTVSYYVYPQYDYTAPIQKITGYRVSTDYKITIRDFTKINDLLASATGLGANTVGSVSFDLSDDLKDKKLDEARKLAVDEAKLKANGLAKAAGINLGKIINISENIPSDNRLYAMPVAGGGALEKIVAEPDIQPGTTEINVIISLSYEVK